MKTEPILWYSDRGNIVTLLWWMEEQGFPIEDIIGAVEKPWKWEDEFKKAEEEF